MEVSGQFHASAALAQRCPLDRRLNEPRAGLSGEEKNPITAPAGNWTTAVRPVA
jgi:hypothetical protein